MVSMRTSALPCNPRLGTSQLGTSQRSREDLSVPGLTRLSQGSTDVSTSPIAKTNLRKYSAGAAIRPRKQPGRQRSGGVGWRRPMSYRYCCCTPYVQRIPSVHAYGHSTSAEDCYWLVIWLNSTAVRMQLLAAPWNTLHVRSARRATWPNCKGTLLRERMCSLMIRRNCCRQP